MTDELIDEMSKSNEKRTGDHTYHKMLLPEPAKRSGARQSSAAVTGSE
jgi:hypothetical protein